MRCCIFVIAGVIDVVSTDSPSSAARVGRCRTSTPAMRSAVRRRPSTSVTGRPRP